MQNEGDIEYFDEDPLQLGHSDEESETHEQKYSKKIKQKF